MGTPPQLSICRPCFHYIGVRGHQVCKVLTQSTVHITSVVQIFKSVPVSIHGICISCKGLTRDPRPVLSVHIPMADEPGASHGDPSNGLKRLIRSHPTVGLRGV